MKPLPNPIDEDIDKILDGLALHVGIILNDMGVATLTDFDKVKVSEVSKKEAKSALQKIILEARIDEWERMQKKYPTAPMIPDFVWKPRLEQLKDNRS